MLSRFGLRTLWRRVWVQVTCSLPWRSAKRRVHVSGAASRPGGTARGPCVRRVRWRPAGEWRTLPTPVAVRSPRGQQLRPGPGQSRPPALLRTGLPCALAVFAVPAVLAPPWRLVRGPLFCHTVFRNVVPPGGRHVASSSTLTPTSRNFWKVSLACLCGKVRRSAHFLLLYAR